MSVVHAYQNRELARNITMQDANGDTVVPAANDILRVTIKRIGETAKLTVTSEEATSNGSSIDLSSTSLLTIMPDDLTFDPGIYSFIIDYYDTSADVWKSVDMEIFSLEERTE